MKRKNHTTAEKAEQALQQIAAIVHHGRLIGYTSNEQAMREIRKLSLPWWNIDECDRLQRIAKGNSVN